MPGLFLHPVRSGQTIADLYKKAFSEAVELYVLSAYLRSWDSSLKLNKNCGSFTFIVGKDFGITRRKACHDVLRWLPRQRKPFFLVAAKISGFHPKALFWRTKGGDCYSLIGSSNLTEAGWKTNYEANVFAKLQRQEFEAVGEWIDKISPLCVMITPGWLKNYTEAKPAMPGRPGMPGEPSFLLSEIELPTYRGQAKMVRARRDKKRKFGEIRPKLISAIRRCASGKLSDTKFYDIINDTWGDHPSRLQGWGWQVTGRTSNFRALCEGLVAILDAQPATRDLTVIRVIDRLREKRVPTRRAFLSELLCLFFPAQYPVLNEPVASYVRPCAKAPRGYTEGEKYVHLARSLRAALIDARSYPARDLLELDGLIWEFQDMQE